MPAYTITPLLLAKLPSEKGPMTYLCYAGQPVIRPYVMWHIRAGDKNVLVDTAIEAEDYRNLHPGFHKMPFQAVQTFEQALARVGCTPGEIDIVIQTHLHMDHVYNTPKCKKAKVYCQEEELKFALNPHPTQEIMYPRRVIDQIDFQLVRGEEAILPGIKVMPVPGHTPGCQAVIIETEKGKAAISGFCSIKENFYPPENVKMTVSPFATYPVIAPGIHTHLFEAYESALKVKATAGIIIPLHDPDCAEAARLP
jgi:N-acyl homoserine lactone hydrolase